MLAADRIVTLDSRSAIHLPGPCSLNYHRCTPQMRHQPHEFLALRSVRIQRRHGSSTKCHLLGLAPLDRQVPSYPTALGALPANGVQTR